MLRSKHHCGRYRTRFLYGLSEPKNRQDGPERGQSCNQRERIADFRLLAGRLGVGRQLSMVLRSVLYFPLAQWLPPVFALFFLFGPMATMQAWRPPSAVAEGFWTQRVRLCIFCANCHGLSRQLSRTIVPTVTDYRANCHRSSGRIGHRFNLRFESRHLAEPFR